MDAIAVDGRLRGSSGCDRMREWGNVIVLREVAWADRRPIKRSIRPPDTLTLSLSYRIPYNTEICENVVL